MSRKKDKGTKLSNTEKETQSNNEPEVENETDTKVNVEIDQSEPKEEPKEEVIELTEEEQLKIRVAELEDKLLRSAAEFDNYKKRMARNYDELIRSAGDRILIGLLDIIDNFERALNSDDNANPESFREGTNLIFSQMTGLLKKHNIKSINALGKTFDPNFHEAVMQLPSKKYDEGIVALEISKGYFHDKRVLRHSKVGVSTGEIKEENNEKSEE